MKDIKKFLSGAKQFSSVIIGLVFGVKNEEEFYIQIILNYLLYIQSFVLILVMVKLCVKSVMAGKQD